MTKHGIAFTDANILAVRRSVNPKTETRRIKEPKYEVGEVVYVKEALVRRMWTSYRCDFRAVWSKETKYKYMPWRWKRDFLSAIFMPSIAARTFLRVLSIRQEFLHDITDEGARAEGITVGEGETMYKGKLRARFQELWESINKKPGMRWVDNPLVWVTKFEKAEEKP